MCYYNLTRYFCGTKAWGSLQRECGEALQNPAPCQRKQVAKHIYSGWTFGNEPKENNGSTYYEPVPGQRLEEPPRPCPTVRCLLESGHSSPCILRGLCSSFGCSFSPGHAGLHNTDLRSLALDLERQTAAASLRQIAVLTGMVLGTMGTFMQSTMMEDAFSEHKDKPRTIRRSRRDMMPTSYDMTSPSSDYLYSDLDFYGGEIRLFELQPSSGTTHIKGSFRSTNFLQCPPYIAVSYMWGEQKIMESVQLDNGGVISIGQNLWHYLHLQASLITEPTLFWIDAVCIDQTNVHERNHQIGLMESIYKRAASVIVWLGQASDESDLAMDFLVRQTFKALQPHGPGYRPLWDPEEGQALYALFERPYWRRIWIIQEILHARNIIVWCGDKRCDWTNLEKLYLKLKTMEDTTWLAHHRLHTEVMQSSATTMLWQRAHYRHRKTPPPTLKTLIKIFQDWRCTDIRDKVYALVGLAAADSQIVPDYGLGTKEIFFMVMNTISDADGSFGNLLSQVLGLSGKDVQFLGQSLIEYKVAPPERLVLQARRDSSWGLD